MGSLKRTDFRFSSSSSASSEDENGNTHHAPPVKIERMHIVNGSPAKKTHTDATATSNSIEEMRREYHYHMRRAQEIFELLTNIQQRPSSLINGVIASSIPSNNSARNIIQAHNIKHIPKALSRKPRDLQYSPSGAQFFATSLDGGIFLWDAQAQSIRSIHYLTSHLNRVTYAEHTCWRNENSLILAAEGVHSEIIQLDLQTQKFETLHLSQHPVTAMSSDVHSVKEHIITGNAEKCIELWGFTKEPSTLLHKKHTSTIQSIFTLGDTVYSGGADCRLVAHSLTRNTPIFEHKHNDRISHITSIDPNSLLVTFCTAEPKQFGVFDIRQERLTMRFGWDEESNITRYLSPSIIPEQKLIACGTSAPSKQRPSSINLFDIRQQGRIIQTIDAASSKEHRRFLKSEYVRDSLTALSTDGTISFIPLSY